MKRGTVQLVWTEKHNTFEEYDIIDGGMPIDLHRALERAVMNAGLFTRPNVIPESIKFSIVED